MILGLLSACERALGHQASGTKEPQQFLIAGDGSHKSCLPPGIRWESLTGFLLCFQGRMLALMNMKFGDVLTLLSTRDSGYP